MGVRGDMAAMLQSKFGLTPNSAREILTAIFEDAKDPNYAYAFHRWCGEGEENDNMSDYWETIDFLKEIV